MQNIGERIKACRNALGMSADTLAEKLGKNRATIYRYESEAIENMPMSIIAPLADALQVSPAYLMGWTDDQQFGMIERVTPEESRLLSLFRGADERARQDAIITLEAHQTASEKKSI